MASSPNTTGLLNSNTEQNSSNLLKPYLQQALNITGNPPNFFETQYQHPKKNINKPNAETEPITTQAPKLNPHTPNTLLLYPGSFNPPHLGHLATILYLSQHRHLLNLTTLILIIDPLPLLLTRHKPFSTPQTLLPQPLRCTLFLSHPSLTPLLSSGFLHLLTSPPQKYLPILSSARDLIREKGFDADLRVFLGGDKITVEKPLCVFPGDLEVWIKGGCDGFHVMNKRRKVDFYVPGLDERPRDLKGCTGWERGEEVEVQLPEEDIGKNGTEGKNGIKEKEDDTNADANVGTLWTCKALTLQGEPTIHFRCSESSASNGVSSTGIRRIMMEAEDGELIESLKDKVVSVEVLVEWLLERRRGAQVLAG